MSLRFFADQCVPHLVVHILREAGHDVFVLKEYLIPTSVDPVVIAKAQELDAILVSLNGDFSDIVTYPPKNYRGIISLQIRNHPEAIRPMMKRLSDYCSAHPEATHYEGKLLLVEVHRIRIKQ
jgi:predicted nuclease of predicted toxin-antitoxin system